MSAERDPGLEAIGSLQEPVRRALYEFVAGARDDVSRDQAAEGVGIQRSLAAFHLDKLVEAGLLEATFRRLTGRTGPGAGRPAKLYRRSSAEHSVTLPPRQYDLAAQLLAEAVEETGSEPVRATVAQVSRRFGRRMGEEVRNQATRPNRERRVSALVDALEDQGYEPRREGSAVRLGNCPFHALTEQHTDLVCGMNLALLEGVVEGIGDPALEAVPSPRPGECCVAVTVKRKA